MDFKQIKELIRLVDNSKIGEVIIKDDGFNIRIRHQNFNNKAIVAAAPHIQTAEYQAAPSATVPAEIKAGSASAEDTSEGQEQSESTDNLITIKSPMIGTFYRSSGPEKPPYVKVGDHIDTGQVLCIIEAMKLFNEIESEYSGKVVKVLIENQQPVEYDQPLFMIEPND